MTEKKRKPKTETTRSEVFAMRLDPKLKYLAEIAARKQRRSLANFIECAIEKALENVHLDEGLTVAQASQELWELDFAARLVKLATYYPELLTYDEHRTWRNLQHEWMHLKWRDFEAGRLKDVAIDADFVRRRLQEAQTHASSENGKKESDRAVDQQNDTAR